MCFLAPARSGRFHPVTLFMRARGPFWTICSSTTTCLTEPAMVGIERQTRDIVLIATLTPSRELRNHDVRCRPSRGGGTPVPGIGLSQRMPSEMRTTCAPPTPQGNPREQNLRRASPASCSRACGTCNISETPRYSSAACVRRGMKPGGRALEPRSGQAPCRSRSPARASSLSLFTARVSQLSNSGFPCCAPLKTQEPLGEERPGGGSAFAISTQRRALDPRVSPRCTALSPDALSVHQSGYLDKGLLSCGPCARAQHARTFQAVIPCPLALISLSGTSAVAWHVRLLVEAAIDEAPWPLIRNMLSNTNMRLSARCMGT